MTHPFASQARRRHCAALALMVVILLAPSVSHADTPRLAVLDWTLTETLLALDVVPAGVAQIDAYEAWVGEPAVPNEVTNLGLRMQPNLELLSMMDPDRILISPMLASAEPKLGRIAPVETFELYSPDADIWQRMEALTRELGELAGRGEAAEDLIRRTHEAIERMGERIPADTRPLLIIQFVDQRHVRVFGANGLFQAVLERLGLDNAWNEKTNYWGFSQVPLERLAGIDARLVVVRPYPVGVKTHLANSGLWQKLPSVRDDTVVTLPPVWSFGALPSARRFAEEMTAALEAGDD